MIQTPKLLPWYAREAGVSERRARALWQRALRATARSTGRQDGNEYLAETMHTFQHLLDAEKSRQATPNVSALVRTQNRLLSLPLTTLELFVGTFTRWSEQQRQCFEAFWQQAA